MVLLAPLVAEGAWSATKAGLDWASFHVIPLENGMHSRVVAGVPSMLVRAERLNSK